MARHYATDDVLDFTGEATRRLRPPKRLHGRARAIFTHVVSTASASHFKPPDQELLERYAEAQALAEMAAAHLFGVGDAVVDATGKLSAWFQVHTVASRTANSLASRLRLTVSARSPKAVKTQPGPQSYYDTMTLEEDDDADGDGADVLHGLGDDNESVGEDVAMDVARSRSHKTLWHRVGQEARAR